MRPRHIAATLVLPLIVVVAGCGGGGSSPTQPPLPPPAALTTFSDFQAQIFSPTCATGGCHDSGTAQAALVLSPGQSFANLVNVPSTQSTLNRVTPNQPEQSYLIKKLRGDVDIVGVRMPNGGPFLSQAHIDAFIAWINDGAPNN